MVCAAYIWGCDNHLAPMTQYPLPADDVLQETAAVCRGNFDQYRSGTKFRTWVSRYECGVPHNENRMSATQVRAPCFVRGTPSCRRAAGKPAG